MILIPKSCKPYHRVTGSTEKILNYYKGISLEALCFTVHFFSDTFFSKTHFIPLYSRLETTIFDGDSAVEEPI